jgi:hypothetical protein
VVGLQAINSVSAKPHAISLKIDELNLRLK